MVGTIVSHNKILEKLRDGGTSVTWQAHDARLDPAVVFTFVLHGITASERENARFLHRAKKVFTLKHLTIRTIDWHTQQNPTPGPACGLSVVEKGTLIYDILWLFYFGIWLNLR